MIYENVWDLTGTSQQQEIVKGALDKIMFPWGKLRLPTAPVEIGWDYLNGQVRQHGNKHEGAEPLMGMIDGRKYILGVFYPGIGSIYIDNALVNYPGAAQTTVSAEIAHSADEFFMTDAMRQQVMKLVDIENYEDTWWEKVDYNTEYFTLVGEGFMQMFTLAYSDIIFIGAEAFSHRITAEQAPEIRRILGIERTDAAQPIQNYFAKTGSTIFHDTHKNKYATTITFATREDAINAGLKPCKVCKP